MTKINTLNGSITISGHPDECPFCHSKITPTYIYGFYNTQTLDVFSLCPNANCQKSFIAYYNRSNGAYNGRTIVGELVSKEFSEAVSSISLAFITIYNQAYSAEQQNLTEICGVGYRKALEFLIKDYAILNHPDHKDKIEKKLLGVCINDYVDDTRIKTVAKRAAWLGNDETHYIRKWEGKNLQDLKKLIELTVHWIEMEILTKSFENEMPE